MGTPPLCGACRTRPCKRKPCSDENDAPLYYEWCASCRDLAGLDELATQLDVREQQLDALHTERRMRPRQAARIRPTREPRRHPHSRKAAVRLPGSLEPDVTPASKRESVALRDTLARYIYASWVAARGPLSLDYTLRRYIVNDPTPGWATDIAYAMLKASLPS